MQLAGFLRGVTGFMLDFSGLTLKDAPQLRSLLTHSHSRLCEYVFGTVLLWRDMWPMEFAVFKDTVFLRLEISAGQVAYMLPVGGDMDRALGILDSYHKGHKLFHYVPQTGVEMLRRRYGSVIAKPLDSGGDYLYYAEAMATLKGRKLHGQRNHFNYFERTRVHRLEKITDANASDVKAFAERISASNSSVLFQEGTRKTLELLDNLDVYGFSSLVLYAQDNVVGFTFGSLLDDTLYVTIEQADRTCRGAYPKLASAFVAEHLDAGAVFVNREDDIGDEGLRKAKLAWNPCEIIEKFSVAVE